MTMKKMMSVLICLICLMFSQLSYARWDGDNWIPDTAAQKSVIANSIKVVWKKGVIVGLLVPPNYTKQQLKSLIYKLREARKNKSLNKYIPPTTPGMPYDQYSEVIVLVFSNPKWAIEEQYKLYERSGMRSTSARLYLNSINASYEYNDLDGKEYGALGYDEGGLRSKHFVKLF